MNHRLWALATGLCAFVVYFLTLAPDVMFTDSGELAGACATLGVAHPTGYPLFVLLGHVWSLLPLPMSIIAKLNLFAAVCTAASVSVFFLFCRVVLQWFATTQSTPHATQTKGAKKSGVTPTVLSSAPMSEMTVNILSAASALLYAFARTVWAQATSIEVYSLHLLLMTTTLYLCVGGILERNQRMQLAGAFVFGLGFTNHLTTILLIVPIVVLFFYRPGERFSFGSERRKEFLIMLGVILSCAVVYGVMILRSSSGAWFNWGGVHRGWDEFTYHVLGKQYQVWMFSDEKGAVSKQLGVFFSLLPYQTAFVGIALAIVGLIAVWKRSRQFALFALLMVLCGVMYSIQYNIHDIDSYFLSAFTTLILLGAIGLAWILQRWNVSTYAAVAMIVPVISLAVNYKENDESTNTLVRDYVHLMVDPLPKNAVVISQQWDFFCSAFWYMQQVEGYRPDVVMIEKEILRRTWYPGQLMKWYPDAIAPCKTEIDTYMQDLVLFESGKPYDVNSIQSHFLAMINSFIDKNITRRPVFTTVEVLQNEQGIGDTHGKVPYGLCLQFTSGESFVNPALLQTESFLAATKRHRNPHLEKDIAVLCSQQLTNTAAYFLVSKRYKQAEDLFRRAAEIDPKNTKAIDGEQKAKQMAVGG